MSVPSDLGTPASVDRANQLGLASASLPPHFPDPNADPVKILEARIVELEEINASQYAEMTAWKTQLEAALAKLNALESNMKLECPECRKFECLPIVAAEGDATHKCGACGFTLRAFFVGGGPKLEAK